MIVFLFFFGFFNSCCHQTSEDLNLGYLLVVWCGNVPAKIAMCVEKAKAGLLEGFIVIRDLCVEGTKLTPLQEI